MIEPTEDGVCLSCDDCSTELELRVHTIERVNELAAKRGWKLSQDAKGRWQYQCPACVEDHKVPVRLHQ